MNTSVAVESALTSGVFLKPWEISEEIRHRFRSLRASLAPSLTGNRAVAVTSLSAGEGVSWVCSRLACAFAESQCTVTLVDANLAAPVQALSFDLSDSDATSSGSMRLWQPAPHLTIAEPHARATPSELRWAVSQLTGTGRIAVIDCEPFLAGASVLELGTALDGVLFVVEAGNRRQEELSDALRRTERAGVRVLGVVVNKHRKYMPDALYRNL